MWKPISRDAAVVCDNPAPALAKPTDAGDKQPIFLIINNNSGADASLNQAADTSLSGLIMANGETWMAGPILGMDLSTWGIFAAAASTVDIIFTAARLHVDARPNPISIHETPPVVDLSNLPFVWRQLV